MTAPVPPALHVDWCSYAAAKYAVEHWHYSRRMPCSKLVRIGAWERSRFVGAIVFSYGATPEIGTPFGLQQIEICELTRVALRDHVTPVSRMLAIAVRMLHRHCPGLRLIVSFADTTRSHHGGIYQAAGWVYVGSSEYHAYRVHGRLIHPRALGMRYGVGGQSIPWLRAHVDPAAERIANGVKHKYLCGLDDDMRRRVAALARPYPKRRAPEVSEGMPRDHRGGGGATPTPALQPAHG